LLPEALEMSRNYASAPASQISGDYMSAPAQDIPFYTLVDPNSPLGPMSDYMNPYSETVLQNTLQKIYDAADKAKLNLGARATSASAYGDARHGIEGSQLQLNTNRAVGETSGNLLKEMFDTAMGWRGSDMARLFGTDKANADYNETALERLYKGDTANATLNETALNRQRTGAQDMLALQGANQNMMLQRLAAMLGAGGLEQGNKQAQLDAAYQEFLRGQSWDANRAAQAASIIRGVPYSSSTTNQGSQTGTSTQTAPDNSLWQLAGTLAGAAFAPVTAGGSTAIASLFT
jgi:hypothetical protein